MGRRLRRVRRLVSFGLGQIMAVPESRGPWQWAEPIVARPRLEALEAPEQEISKFALLLPILQWNCADQT